MPYLWKIQMSYYSFFIINEDYTITPAGDSDNEWISDEEQ